MLVSYKLLVQNVLNHKGTLAIWGLSTTTKKILQENSSLCTRVDLIIESDSTLHNQLFENKKILSLEECLAQENLLIILWGNHVQSMALTLQKKGFQNFLIDYEHSRNYFPQTLVVKLDYLKQTNDLHNFNYKFCDAVIEYCTKNSIECHIKPYVWWQKGETKENIFAKYLLYNTKLPKDTLHFSYHSVGESDPQVLRYKEGYLYKTITFDPNGYSGWSSLAQDPERIFSKVPSKRLLQNHLKKLQKRYIANHLSKYQQKDCDFEFPEQFIFFPLQTFNDTVMLHSYFDPLYLLHTLVALLHKKKIPLVIKRHPRCENEALQKQLLEYEREKKIILFEGSIHSAIAKASTVYVINSGVGFEALMHLKPVVSFGRSDYMQATKNIKNLAELNMNPWHELSQENEEKIKQFLYYYTNEKSIEIGKAKIKKKVHSFVIDYINKEHYASSFK